MCEDGFDLLRGSDGRVQTRGVINEQFYFNKMYLVDTELVARLLQHLVIANELVLVFGVEVQFLECDPLYGGGIVVQMVVVGWGFRRNRSEINERK